ncbi:MULTISPECIES: hypothetical protein [Staphylococcus]|uniref:hypothetical protein n=1 Tax=Staphylococcus TaxID=1279 RepID=UPI00044CD3D2|nr:MULTISPECIES: hypothetical protein [Staphylococcus]EWR66278.1 hypothetical protein T969_02774 [Staphylococcus aureus FVRH6079]MBG3415761.1 hypothetical protein [Staphylococcus aureus]MCE3336762.1 hypothetical protein [Staphylococcus aureus]MDS4063036.1 hypothetical protein [Staphylococcus capitis]GFD66650.1 hypothetical protein ksw1_26270 [Staphylococcus aureus]
MDVILYLLFFGFIGGLIYRENQKGYNQYQDNIERHKQDLASNIQVNEINNIATDEINRDEIIFDCGLSTSIRNNDLKFVDSEDDEMIEYYIPSGKEMSKFYKKTFTLNRVTDHQFNVYLHEYVLKKGLKVYITKERYQSLKRNPVTTAYE